MPRLFVALPIGRDVVQELAGVGSTLREATAGSSATRDLRAWRWVRPESMHLTLAFLGDVAEHRVGVAGNALRRSVEGMPELNLAATGIGAFPHLDRARVLWAGVKGDLRHLRELQSVVAAALRQMGLPIDDRPFHPHITLARARSPWPLPDGLDRSMSFGTWRAGEVILYESRTEPAGARYVVRAAAVLGGGTGSA
ncbi:MAG TPA: RNA 2',3'-cyclic phosphodiesterase [Trueperaceae bacterium]